MTGGGDPLEVRPPPHPATYPAAVLDVIDRLLGPAVRVLDPFAGVGGIHALRDRGRETWGVELEPEWAAASPWTIPGDARALPFGPATFDAVATSPAYGNRLADTYDGRDGSRRYTYRLALGRPLTVGNSGGLQWGPEYRALHRDAWAEAARVLTPAGRLVLNIKDHVRRGRRQYVTEWHLDALAALGFRLAETVEVPTRGIRHGRNHAARVEFETVALLILHP